VAARLRRLISVCAEYGISVERPSSGSHWKAKKPGFRTYPIPAPNGEKTEISDAYIRGLCRSSDLDRDEFVGKL
jgi:hypothetical protein